MLARKLKNVPPQKSVRVDHIRPSPARINSPQARSQGRCGACPRGPGGIVLQGGPRTLIQGGYGQSFAGEVVRPDGDKVSRLSS